MRRTASVLAGVTACSSSRRTKAATATSAGLGAGFGGLGVLVEYLRDDGDGRFPEGSWVSRDDTLVHAGLQSACVVNQRVDSALSLASSKRVCNCLTTDFTGSVVVGGGFRHEADSEVAGQLSPRPEVLAVVGRGDSRVVGDRHTDPEGDRQSSDPADESALFACLSTGCTASLPWTCPFVATPRCRYRSHVTTARASTSSRRADAPVGKEEVVAAVLRSAADLFAERGLAATSVRDIAARSRVNHGLIHRHFGSKDGLVAAVLDHLGQHLAELLAQRRRRERGRRSCRPPAARSRVCVARRLPDRRAPEPLPDDGGSARRGATSAPRRSQRATRRGPHDRPAARLVSVRRLPARIDGSGGYGQPHLRTLYRGDGRVDPRRASTGEVS